jgi:hypothetical protein
MVIQLTDPFFLMADLVQIFFPEKMSAGSISVFCIMITLKLATMKMAKVVAVFPYTFCSMLA